MCGEFPLLKDLAEKKPLVIEVLIGKVFTTILFYYAF